MFQWQRFHFIDELERYGCHFEMFNPLIYDNLDEANEKLIERIKEKHYDLFFTNLCNEKHLYVDTLKEIKKLGIPSVSFRSDNLIIPFNDKSLAPYFDIVWITSEETTPLYEKWGGSVYFAPYAANPFIYKQTGGSMVRKACFIGSPYGSRSIAINTISSAQVSIDLFCGKNEESANEHNNGVFAKYTLTQLTGKEIFKGRLSYPEGRKLLVGAVLNRLFGQINIENNEYATIKPSLSFEDMIRTYSSYALSLAYTSSEQTDVMRSPLKIIDLRNFEIPMCGGLEICRYNKELASYYEEGKEIVFYHTKEELQDKVKYYTEKAAETEIQGMKMAARKRAAQEHTWMVRFSGLFDKLSLK